MSALLYVIGTGVFVVVLTALAAWLYQKTRKRLEHDTLGLLVYSGGTWNGRRVHFLKSEPAVRFELPGDRDGPDREGVERFEQLWGEIQSILSSIRPAAMAEYSEIKDCDDSKEHLDLVAEIAAATEHSPQGFDEYWHLLAISLLELETPSSEATWQWCLEFDVAWDLEHTRAARLNLNKELMEYNLTCAMPV